MVRDGIPHSLRPYVWMRLRGALQKRASSEMSYKQIVKASTNDHLVRSGDSLAPNRKEMLITLLR